MENCEICGLHYSLMVVEEQYEYCDELTCDCGMWYTYYYDTEEIIT